MWREDLLTFEFLKLKLLSADGTANFRLWQCPHLLRVSVGRIFKVQHPSTQPHLSW